MCKSRGTMPAVLTLDSTFDPRRSLQQPKAQVRTHSRGGGAETDTEGGSVSVTGDHQGRIPPQGWAADATADYLRVRVYVHPQIPPKRVLCLLRY